MHYPFSRRCSSNSNSSHGSSSGTGSRVTIPPSHGEILKGEDGYLAPIPAKQSGDNPQSPKHSQQQQQQPRQQQQQPQPQHDGGNLRRSQVEPLHVQTSGIDRGGEGRSSGGGSGGSGDGWQQHLSPTKQTTSPKHNENKVKMR